MVTRTIEGILWEVESPSKYIFDSVVAQFDGKDWKIISLPYCFKNMNEVSKYLVRELEGPM